MHLKYHLAHDENTLFDENSSTYDLILNNELVRVNEQGNIMHFMERDLKLVHI